MSLSTNSMTAIGGAVAEAESGPHDPRIASVPPLEARSEVREQLADRFQLSNARNCQPPRVQIATLSKSYQPLDIGPEFLRLRQRRSDLLVLDQGAGHVGKHGAPVR